MVPPTSICTGAVYLVGVAGQGTPDILVGSGSGRYPAVWFMGDVIVGVRLPVLRWRRRASKPGFTELRCSPGLPPELPSESPSVMAYGGVTTLGSVT